MLQEHPYFLKLIRQLLGIISLLFFPRAVTLSLLQDQTPNLVVTIFVVTVSLFHVGCYPSSERVLAQTHLKNYEQLLTVTHIEPTNNSAFILFWVVFVCLFSSRIWLARALEDWGEHVEGGMVCVSCICCTGTVLLDLEHTGNTTCRDCDPLSCHLQYIYCFSYKLFFFLCSILFTSKKCSLSTSMHQFFVNKKQLKENRQ